MNNVELVPYHCGHDAILHTFYLPEEQKQFTGMPDEMLTLAKENPHRHPVVITATRRPVGFFILYDGDELADYTNTAEALLLRAFSIITQIRDKDSLKKGCFYYHSSSPDTSHIFERLYWASMPAICLPKVCIANAALSMKATLKWDNTACSIYLK